jgi:cytidine deaminase
MPAMLSLLLPARALPDTVTESAYGRIVVPGHVIAEKRVTVDPALMHQLITAARAAAQKAHAPFSKFKVGAALVMADDPEGVVFAGANVENSSYGVCSCGERTALNHAVAQGFRRLKMLAVSCVAALNAPLCDRSPCGICRQAIKEFTNQNIHIDDALILIDTGAADVLCEVFDIERLLPYGFIFLGPDM